MFEAIGGSTPVTLHTRRRTTTHSKHVYPATGWNGGGFQTKPRPSMLLLT